MKSPLRKRVGREIKGETGKYIVIFLFMTALIAIASGFFVADESLKKSYDESFEKYNIEDGNFEFALKPDEQLIGSIENEGGLKLFENYYSMQESVGDSRIRLFTDRKDVNKVCILEGRLPDNDKEISLDRLYMKSNDLKKGDSIKVADKKLEIVGIVALPDYSALYENNTDFMFDTEKFGVGIITQNLFEEFSNTNIHYSYSWKYN